VVVLRTLRPLLWFIAFLLVFWLGVFACQQAHAQVLLTPELVHVSGDFLFEPGAAPQQLTWGHNCGAIPLDGDVLMWRLDVPPDQVVLAPLDETGMVVTAVTTGDDTVASQLCSALVSPDIP
jgi:hypothetical protein